MAAALQIDDNLLAYSKEELTFLMLLARLLPTGCVLRSTHEHHPPSPLKLAIDLRMVEEVHFPSITERTPKPGLTAPRGSSRTWRSGCCEPCRNPWRTVTLAIALTAVAG